MPKKSKTSGGGVHFRVGMWFGKAARGGGSRQGAPAAYLEYIEWRWCNAGDLRSVMQRIEAEARQDHPKYGRLGLYDVKVEVV